LGQRTKQERTGDLTPSAEGEGEEGNSVTCGEEGASDCERGER